MQGVIRTSENRVAVQKKSSEAVRAQRFKSNLVIVLSALFILGIFVVMQIALLENFTENEPTGQEIVADTDAEPHAWLGPLMKERLKRMQGKIMKRVGIKTKTVTLEPIAKEVPITSTAQSRKTTEVGHGHLRKRAANAVGANASNASSRQNVDGVTALAKSLVEAAREEASIGRDLSSIAIKAKEGGK